MADEPKRVLFLDIDGVLNSRECWERLRGSRHKIDRDKVALLNDVVAATGCRIVVSSTWRLGVGQGPRGCRAILRSYGLKARFGKPWRTIRLWPPDDVTSVSEWFAEHRNVRGEEIADWLARNGNPPFAIVDDDSDMLPEQLPCFVQTTFDDGLKREHADRLIALLSSRPTCDDTSGIGDERG